MSTSTLDEVSTSTLDEVSTSTLDEVSTSTLDEVSTSKRGYGIHRLLPQPHEADVYQPPHMVLLMMHSCDLRVQPHI